MKLSDFVSKISDIYIYRDGEFNALDFANSRLNNKILTFIDDERYINRLSEYITCIICNSKIAKILPEKYGICLSNNPRLDFYLTHNYLNKNSSSYMMQEFKTSIGENCKINNRSSISSKNVVIGNNVTIEEQVIIRENVKILDNSIIRAGAIIGGEGFQFNKVGKTIFIEHGGGVIIGKDVEVQYNTCIDKAIFPWDNTIIGNETKIDNLVHVGHAAKIGERCLVAANALIGGSTVIGNDCWIGVSATISNGLIIGNNTSIKIGAVVTKNVPDGISVSGNFAIEHNKFIKFVKSIS
ncbi:MULTISPECIES: UDP-3-O-(3-hydroxymyristoyl)glucosamine N-acyltransferase [unclassified Clostridium]|uniref:UDP-3-O-(3-hydroxymyristoyl)glucosamine N-acyltransferase n=1 Tax=unclassified Clostridium TaxID=2614128 RepID=UPI0002975BD1|nr:MULTISPECIES: UDP-3-O-(3-hydroxymyristoyl)glucosamine N-acyltransferase [unclassified Clostridium]EKQ57009.1 MAG: UDP-3-O-(3-hydroxymyristoyl) glucosamine N-acyltransferase [Clostridium sp. Maddingley MBC34-26]